MNLREFIFLFVKSLNPLNYPDLASRKKREVLAYFLLLILFSVTLSAVVRLPDTISAPEKIASSLSKFENFKISIEASSNETIVLLNRPKIILDLTGNRTSLNDEAVVLTSSEIWWKKFEPSIFGLRIFKTEKKEFTEFKELLTNKDKLTKLFWLFFILASPALLAFFYFISLVKYGLLALIMSIIAYLAFKAKKKHIKLFAVFRLAVFSISLMVFLESAFSFLRLGIIPVILSMFIFIVGLITTSHDGKKRE